MLVVESVWQPQNCTTRRSGAGVSRAPLAQHVMSTQRPCCPTAKCWQPGGAGNVVGVPHTAELYDPEAGIWSSTNDLNTEHYRHTATLLPNGMALVAGGLHSTLGILAIAEL